MSSYSTATTGYTSVTLQLLLDIVLLDTASFVDGYWGVRIAYVESDRAYLLVCVKITMIGTQYSMTQTYVSRKNTFKTSFSHQSTHSSQSHPALKASTHELCKMGTFVDGYRLGLL